jgi:endoribonuclease Dicer
MEEHYNPAVITHMKHSRNADQSLAAMCVALGLADRTTEMDRLVDREVKRYKAQVGAKFKEAENILKRKSRKEVVGEEEETLVDGKVTEFWNGTSHAPVSYHLGFPISQ